MLLACPMCKQKLTVPDGYEFRPFCSARCKQLDLLNWIEGRYCLPRELTAQEIDELPSEQREQVFSGLLTQPDQKPVGR